MIHGVLRENTNSSKMATHASCMEYHRNFAVSVTPPAEDVYSNSSLLLYVVHAGQEIPNSPAPRRTFSRGEKLRSGTHNKKKTLWTPENAISPRGDDDGELEIFSCLWVIFDSSTTNKPGKWYSICIGGALFRSHIWGRIFARSWISPRSFFFRFKTNITTKSEETPSLAVLYRSTSFRFFFSWEASTGIRGLVHHGRFLADFGQKLLCVLGWPLINYLILV